jgi:hypothetical protein
MSKMYTGSINLSRIEKDKIVKGAKSGDLFTNVVVWINDEKDEYGNDGAIQQQTKKGEAKIYLGNFKAYEKQEDTIVDATPEETDDLPF